MQMTIYTANCAGKAKNAVYPNKRIISNADDFTAAIAYDHVCAKFKQNHRGKDDFISADCLVMDNDNTHSDNPEDWIYPGDYASMFSDIAYIIAPSRHNMKVKEGKSARPRHHIYFPLNTVTDADTYADLKKKLLADYPFFDSGAIDAARFIYGHATDDIIWNDSDLTVEFIFSFTKGTIPYGSRNSTMSRFAGKVLKRFGETDEAHNIFLEKAGKCSPPLDDEELKTVWRSALKFFRKIAKSPNYIPADKYENLRDNGDKIKWDEPIPLENEVLPTFPIESLPRVLRDYALSAAESTQTSVDMAAAGILAVASACMRNLYKVEAKADWQEPTNIYVLIVAEPSERKTAVISLLKKPVDEFVEEYNKAHKVEFEMSKAVKQRLENTKNRLISSARKKGEESVAEDFNDKLQEVIEQLVNFKEQKPMRVYVDDTTPEKLVEILAENNNAISIISSEGGIFDVLSGTYSGKVNIDVFLKAYSGERIAVDRIMRDSIFIDDACLTILLTVQPVVISDLMSNKKFRHRGLTARFLYTAPMSYVGERKFNSQPIDPKCYEDYKNLIYNILSENKTINLIKLTDGARSVLNEYYDWVEKRLAGEFSVYGDWVGKLVGNTLRIAGILARVSVLKKDIGDAFLESDPPVEINKATMEDAVRIGKYFFSQAVSAYSEMGIHSEFKAALKALEKIRSSKEEKITRRGLMRICRWISRVEEAQSILDTLEDCGYVRIVTVENADRARGGRPKNAEYSVNPMVFES